MRKADTIKQGESAGRCQQERPRAQQQTSENPSTSPSNHQDAPDMSAMLSGIIARTKSSESSPKPIYARLEEENSVESPFLDTPRRRSSSTSVSDILASLKPKRVVSKLRKGKDSRAFTRRYSVMS